MPAVTLNRFVEALRQSTLLAEEQRIQLAELHPRCGDSRELALELLNRHPRLDGVELGLTDGGASTPSEEATERNRNQPPSRTTARCVHKQPPRASDRNRQNRGNNSAAAIIGRP